VRSNRSLALRWMIDPSFRWLHSSTGCSPSLPSGTIRFLIKRYVLESLGFLVSFSKWLVCHLWMILSQIWRNWLRVEWSSNSLFAHIAALNSVLNSTLPLVFHEGCSWLWTLVTRSLSPCIHYLLEQGRDAVSQLSGRWIRRSSIFLLSTSTLLGCKQSLYIRHWCSWICLHHSRQTPLPRCLYIKVYIFPPVDNSFFHSSGRRNLEVDKDDTV